MQTESLHYLEFSSQDIKASIQFFTQVFKWEFTLYGEAYAAFSFVTMDNPRTESLDQINAEIIKGFSGSNYKINEFTGLMGYLETLRVKDRVSKRNKLIQRYKTNLIGTDYELVEQKAGHCSYYKCILKILLLLTIFI